MIFRKWVLEDVKLVHDEIEKQNGACVSVNYFNEDVTHNGRLQLFYFRGVFND